MSLGVNPITVQAQPKKPLTKGQKAAITTGAVLATAATAATIAACVIGGKKAPDAKLLAKIGTGFGEMGSFIAKNAKVAGEFVSAKAKATGEFVSTKAKAAGETISAKTKSASEWVSNKTKDADKAIKESFEALQAKFHKTAEVAEEVIEDLEENLPVGHA